MGLIVLGSGGSHPNANSNNYTGVGRTPGQYSALRGKHTRHSHEREREREREGVGMGDGWACVLHKSGPYEVNTRQLSTCFASLFASYLPFRIPRASASTEF